MLRYKGKSFYNKYFNKVNEHGIPALMCICYAKAFDSMEEVPASMIEIR